MYKQVLHRIKINNALRLIREVVCCVSLSWNAGDKCFIFWSTKHESLREKAEGGASPAHGQSGAQAQLSQPVIARTPPAPHAPFHTALEHTRKTKPTDPE